MREEPDQSRLTEEGTSPPGGGACSPQRPPLPPPVSLESVSRLLDVRPPSMPASPVPPGQGVARSAATGVTTVTPVPPSSARGVAAPSPRKKRPPQLNFQPKAPSTEPDALADVCDQLGAKAQGRSGVLSTGVSPMATSKATSTPQDSANSSGPPMSLATTLSPPGSGYGVEVHGKDELKKLVKIGQGASGVVEKHLHLRTGTEVALKMVPANDIAENQRKAICVELKTFANCRNPHIVAFYGAFVHDNFIHIALEYMNAGALSDVLEVRSTTTENILSNITWQVLDGLEYLHGEMRVIHRDIKPSNLLLSTAGVLKITDFGVSGELQDELAQSHSCFKNTWVGTIYYMSPERVEGKPYKYDSDLWSLGLTMLECLSGCYPYTDSAKSSKKHLSFWELMKRIVERDAPQLPPDAEFSEDLRDFLEHVLQKDPEKRKSASAAVMKGHRWLIGSFGAEQQAAVAAWILAATSSDESAEGSGGGNQNSASPGGPSLSSDERTSASPSAGPSPTRGPVVPMPPGPTPVPPNGPTPSLAWRLSRHGHSVGCAPVETATPAGSEGGGARLLEGSESAASPTDSSPGAPSLSSSYRGGNPFTDSGSTPSMSSSVHGGGNPFLDAAASTPSMGSSVHQGNPFTLDGGSPPQSMNSSFRGGRGNLFFQTRSSGATASDQGFAASGSSSSSSAGVAAAFAVAAARDAASMSSAGREALPSESGNCGSGHLKNGDGRRPCIAEEPLTVQDFLAAQSLTLRRLFLAGDGSDVAAPAGASVAAVSELREADLQSWETCVQRISSSFSPDAAARTAGAGSKTSGGEGWLPPPLPCRVDAREVGPGLYLGDAASARDAEGLKAIGVHAVLNCGAPAVEYPPGIEQLFVHCEDTEGYPLLARHLDECLTFAERCESLGAGLLVHCVMGLNRSASLVVAFLMLSQGMTLSDAVRRVWDRRGRMPILTNGSFRRQLVQLAHLTGRLG